MKLQTCRRHPSAGRFMVTCSGCAQELHDMQARNEAMAAARAALSKLYGMGDALITDATITNTGHLVVASALPDTGRYIDLPLCVDVFRQPTAAETDPDQVDPIAPGTWLLAHQWGAQTAADHAAQWVTARREYTRRINLAA